MNVLSEFKILWSDYDRDLQRCIGFRRLRDELLRKYMSLLNSSTRSQHSAPLSPIENADVLQQSLKLEKLAQYVIASM